MESFFRWSSFLTCSGEPLHHLRGHILHLGLYPAVHFHAGKATSKGTRSSAGVSGSVTYMAISKYSSMPISTTDGTRFSLSVSVFGTAALAPGSLP